MMTTAQSGIFKQKIFSASLETKELGTYSDAVQHKMWRTAMKEEYNALIQNNAWTVVSMPQNKNIVGCRWTYRIKQNSDGSISKYKARLVAKGYSQQCGFDFNETYSPVVKPNYYKSKIKYCLV